MKFKDDTISWTRMDPRLTASMDRIDDVHMKTVERHAIITAARDGTHKPGSLHFMGRAIDLRTRDLTKGQIIALQFALKASIGGDFQIILEDDHLHVELDPK